MAAISAVAAAFYVLRCSAYLIRACTAIILPKDGYVMACRKCEFGYHVEFTRKFQREPLKGGIKSHAGHTA